MTADELRVQLAEAMGWKKLPATRDLPWGASAIFPEYHFNHQLPQLSELVRTAEGALSVNQKAQYSVAVCRDVKAFTPLPLDLFKLITASDEVRAAALLEVLKCA